MVSQLLYVSRFFELIFSLVKSSYSKVTQLQKQWLWWQEAAAGGLGGIHGCLNPTLRLTVVPDLQSTELRLLLSVEYR